MSTTGGYSTPAFRKVEAIFRRQLDKAPGGGAACVYYRGEPVVDIWGGAKNEAGDPWAEDTLSVSFSTTKGVTSTLLHQLVEEGKLDYDDPVSKHWPEFAANGKETITIRDILTHRAGLFGIRDLGLTAADLTDWNRVTTALAKAPPNLDYQSHSVYHALTFGWLIGELINRASGEFISDRVRTALAEPLDLDGCYIGVPDSEHHRMAELLIGRDPDAPRPPDTAKKRRNRKMRRALNKSWGRLGEWGLVPDFSAFLESVTVEDFQPRLLNRPDYLRAAIPAVNGVFTARSLARLYGALARGGELDGGRILEPETVGAISEQQVFALDRSLYAPMRWRMGFHQPFVLRRRRPRKAFGHFGFGGSGAWADPARELSVAITVNAGTGTPWGDMRILRVGAAALRCAEKA
jgi:CubicO group peptidase (beta-lactamase class C family)